MERLAVSQSSTRFGARKGGRGRGESGGREAVS